MHGVMKCTERPHGTVGSGQNKKSLYRFHPDTADSSLNIVVPYKINITSFSKAKHDLFVMVGCANKSSAPHTHTPVHATLLQVFGAVGEYNAYVAYQLSRHEIAPSIARFTNPSGGGRSA